ncbi:MAG: hypothetical protein PHW62_03900, partial [Candidatus Ratteibacteria bacterium]|nr:hypothetical protein [Candidatus Ratteibacteria bacterium]
MPDFKEMKTHIKNIIGWSLVIYFFAVICFYFSIIAPLKKQLVLLQQKTGGLKQTVEQLKSEYAKKWDQEKEEILGIIESFKQKEHDKDAVLSNFFQIS